MIPARNRLKLVSNRGFGPLFKGRFLNIKAKNNDVGYHRFAVLVSKKYSPKAAERNKIKRNIYRFLEINKKFLTNPENSRDYLIIILTNEAAARDNDEILKEELKKILSDY